MKGLIAALLLFALVLGGVILDTVLCARAIDTLEEALARIPDDDIETARVEAEQFRQMWEKYFFLLAVSVPREHVGRVEEELSDLTGAIEGGETADLSMSLENMRETLSHARRAVVPSWSYII